MSLSIDAVGVALSSPDTHASPPVPSIHPLQGVAPQPVAQVSSPGPAVDTVQLSVSSQIRLLVRQGVSVGQIANTLGLTESLVNSYLFVPVSTDIALTTTSSQGV